MGILIVIAVVLCVAVVVATTPEIAPEELEA